MLFNVRALVDSGAEVSIINFKIYQSLKMKTPLRKIDVYLQSVNGEQLKVHGLINLSFSLKGTNLSHNFYIVSNMNRNIILGQEWLMKNGVRMYYDLGCLRVNNTYVPLIEDIHIASVVRLKSTLVLKPHTAYICKGRVKNNPQISKQGIYQVSSIEQSFINNDPGLEMTSAVIKLDESGSCPVRIVNYTGKMYTLKKGCIIGRVSVIVEECIHQINTDVTNQYTSEKLTTELNCPKQHKEIIINLLQKKDILAKKDTDLTPTDTLKMKIDSYYTPIKLRPYRTLLNTRKIIDKAVDEMLEANIIERSRSSYAFPERKRMEVVGFV